jgi:para-nitrobenzyl esterase
MFAGRISRRLGAGICAVTLALVTLTTTAIAAGASTVPTPTGNTSGAPVVVTASGAIRGNTVGGANEFLGVPYAAPPVGPLRWQAPQPVAHWRGVRDATTYGPSCPQTATPFGLAGTSEDCLYLNVYAPASSRQGGNRPVVVWIHGGGLWLGESQDIDASQLASNGTVVISINYRLGALGFLAHPALADSSGASGNYGFMDQQAALRWVQQNARSFGGNPGNVTIAGESAGGTSVLAQLASPGARGLFDRAIVESGSFALNQTPLATAEAAGEAFASKAGCANQTAACLRSLPVSTILDDQTQTGYVPGVVDGKVLKQTVGAALANGQFNRVPIINGTNHDEERLFVAIGLSINFGHTVPIADPTITATNYQAEIASTLSVTPATAAVIATQYPVSAYSSPEVAFSALDTDQNFACPALQMDQWTSKYVPTFAYEFNDENAPERYLSPTQIYYANFPFGAAHESELQYLFGLPTAGVSGALTGQQQQLATSMQTYWSSFVARGFPSSFGQPPWPAFSSHTQQMLSLVPTRPQLESNFAATHHCAFWATNG